MTYWRTAGLTYLRYSTIAAKQVRRAVKADLRPDLIRETSTIKIAVKAEPK